MKKLLLTLTAALLLQTLFAGAAGARYLNSYDKTVFLQTGLNLVVPVDTGTATFELQESVHDVLTSSTGLEVDHFYFWVEVDGQTLLGVDPAAAMF